MTKIYICGHTDFYCPVSDPVYEILDSRKLYQEDVAPNGIDGLFYSELLSYKYVADNYALPDYIGFCGYRKYFSFMDEVPDLPSLVDEYGCIAADMETRPRSIYKQYAKSFCFADMDVAMGIVASLYPDLYVTFKRMLEGNVLYPCNMFVMRKEDFKDVIGVVWNVLERLVDVIGTDIVARINSHPKIYLTHKRFGTIPYQYRIGGNIGERLVSAYIMHLFPEAKTYPIEYTEERKPFKELRE